MITEFQIKNKTKSLLLRIWQRPPTRRCSRASSGMANYGPFPGKLLLCGVITHCGVQAINPPPAPTIYETTCCSHFTVRSSIEILSRKKKKKYIFGRSPFPHTAYRFSFPFDFTTWSHTKRLFDVVWTLSSAVSCQTKKKNLRLRWALGVTRSSFRECHVVEQITCQFWGFFFFPFR